MRHVTAFLSIVPGLGHIYIGRCLKGVFLFMLFALFIDAAYIVPFLFSPETRVVRGTLVAAAIVWFYTFSDVVRLTYLANTERKLKRKNELFATGVRQFLRGEYEPARDTFHQVLRLNRYDPDAHFYIGMAFKSLGKPYKARKHLKNALSYDDTKKWNFEVLQELKGT